MGEQVALHGCAGGVRTREQVDRYSLSKIDCTVSHIFAPRSSS
jgi:hypothetical protein